MVRLRLKKKYRLKAWLILFFISLTCFLIIPKSNRKRISHFFGTECINYQQIYSKKLTDRLVDYAEQAKSTGIVVCADEGDITKRVLKGQLAKVRGGRRYDIGKMDHSYPYLTRDSKRLLNEIHRRFRKKAKEDGMLWPKFTVTSMTRTSESVKILMRNNGNASENSPHMYGNAFDISYASFTIRKLHVIECDEWYLKEALAEVIWELRKEKKCWATYEKSQGCFHVVSRK